MVNEKLKKILVEEVKKQLQEKMMLASFKEFAEIVTNAYIDAPVFDPKATRHWTALIKANDNLYNKINSQLKKIYKNKNPDYNKNPSGGGIEIVDYHPYQTADEMATKVFSSGIYLVSSADSEHPLFNVEQNVKFRAVHDFYGHLIAKADFGLRGEIRTFNSYAKLLPRDAVPAAFTEIVGQACHAIVKGSFATQKVAILEGFDYYKVGSFLPGYKVVNKKLIKED